MQVENNTFRDFLRRTDDLAYQMGINIQELPDILGLGRASLFACRAGKRPITSKTMAKLAAAEAKLRNTHPREDTVAIEVAQREAEETRRKELPELIVKALQMAQEENDQLRARVADLESKLAVFLEANTTPATSLQDHGGKVKRAK